VIYEYWASTVACCIIDTGAWFYFNGILRAFSPRRFSSDLHWTVTSLLIALTLNLILLLPFLLFGLKVSMNQNLITVASTIKDAPVGIASTYVFALNPERLDDPKCAGLQGLTPEDKEILQTIK